MVQVKVCGLTRPRDVELCLELEVDRIGFVFAPSPRQIDLQQLDALLAMGRFFWSAVLVDAQPQLVQALLERDCPCLQFHGAESSEQMQLYQGRALLVKALRVGHPDHLRVDYPVDEYLLDGARPGQGLPFDWAWLAQHRPRRPFYLAGGLTPENVAVAIEQVRPLGVDVSSGVEASPGHKCEQKLRRFVAQVRASG